MASEASRKKAEALLAGSFVEHTEECQHALWDEPGCTCGREELRDEIAAALDAARREGEQKSIAITHDLLSEAEQRGAERERWECHRLARACERERLSQMRTMDDFGRRDCVEAKATEATRIADAISARGPMRWREEGEE